MNNPFDYTPSAECEEAFRNLLQHLETLKDSERECDRLLCRELEEGKMLGVLIASDKEGHRHTLYAFSGQLGHGGFHHPDFVEPVFDYLRPNGHFKREEEKIVCVSRTIAEFERDVLRNIEDEYRRIKEEVDVEMAAFKERCRLLKLEREARRKSGDVDEAQLSEMIRRSQYEKAELRRMRKRGEERLSPSAERLAEAERELAGMKERRREDSERLQGWLFDNFKVLDAQGKEYSLSEIFAATPLRVPPSGAGECCAPKLLQAAYRRGWMPESMAEYWYGRPKEGEVRIHGRHYPACRGKCLPVLGRMLKGLKVEPPLGQEEEAHLPEPRIIYENEWFCVVDKPSGMLSVPGKGKALSLQEWLEKRYGKEKGVKAAHRLDQDTSGLLVATFGPLAFKEMQRLFATRKVRKTYIADLEGNYLKTENTSHGFIDLPLSPDILDRPRQRVDYENGKEALTEYEFLSSAEGKSRILFHPHTGRTHQLRVHSASGEGLSMPIIGDRLYGRREGDSRERLHLHAGRMEFTFPPDGQTYRFESPAPF